MRSTLSKASRRITVTSVDSALHRSGSFKASCNPRRTRGYSRKPEASICLSCTDRPKKATETASNASVISGENMRISAAARNAPARPDLTSTSGANASTNRSTNTSIAGRCMFIIERAPADDDESDSLSTDNCSAGSPSSSPCANGSVKSTSERALATRRRTGSVDSEELELRDE